jgi:hypothetical protein
MKKTFNELLNFYNEKFYSKSNVIINSPDTKTFNIMHELIMDAQKYKNKGEIAVCNEILMTVCSYIETQIELNKP